MKYPLLLIASLGIGTVVLAQETAVEIVPPLEGSILEDRRTVVCNASTPNLQSSRYSRKKEISLNLFLWKWEASEQSGR